MTQPDGASRKLTIGVDVGGTNVRAARIGPDGQMSGLVKVRTDSMSSPPDVVEALVRRLMSDDVVAVGVGIPGRLDHGRSRVLSAGFVNVAGISLGEILSTRIGLPVVMDNDAHMALEAELAIGAAKDVDHVVMFTVGTGIGGAIAENRRVLRGRGNAGQLGHLTVDPNGPECKCGRRGCSEVFVSGTALTALMADTGISPGTSIESLLTVDGPSPAAVAVLAQWVASWRHAIDTVVAVLDPDLVVLGGGLGVAAATALQRAAPESPWFDCPVVAAALGDDAGVVGAGLRAFAG